MQIKENYLKTKCLGNMGLSLLPQSVLTREQIPEPLEGPEDSARVFRSGICLSRVRRNEQQEAFVPVTGIPSVPTSHCQREPVPSLLGSLLHHVRSPCFLLIMRHLSILPSFFFFWNHVDSVHLKSSGEGQPNTYRSVLCGALQGRQAASPHDGLTCQLWIFQ